MAISLASFLSVMCLCASVALLNPISCNAQYFFIFGDSIFDPGNAIFIDPANPSPAFFPPYGETFPGHPTGRLSDGRLIPDFIATFLNIPFIPPVLNTDADFSHGASFASAGAGVFNNYDKAMNLEQQYGNFTQFVKNWKEQYGEAEVDKRLKEAVYLMNMGGNDHFTFNTKHPIATFAEMQEYATAVVGNFTIIVKKIYTEFGARKFMFQNVAPVGCLPMNKQENSITGDGCAPNLLTLASLHNDLLDKVMESMKKSSEYPGFTSSIFDFFTQIKDRISRPTDFGFEEGAIACCGTGSNRGEGCGGDGSYEKCEEPSKYVYFDGGHNTEATYLQLALLMWNGTSDAVYPHTMEHLFSYVPIHNVNTKPLFLA
ncbi:GDSL esterase/lipase [Ricinus communis]|uniref:Esterase, putative n=1 Tax=Ricinus communis TaxID=3988 RepID=B9RVK4_RICCO|nr:GDSL esterase/lipase [Ricinus communis]EEF44580.1 Esterase precursor, putative [Ricinus communis]|eukprot:XP_002517773.1 GDSL esterase/lipase [Ricinus communis]